MVVGLLTIVILINLIRRNYVPVAMDKPIYAVAPVYLLIASPSTLKSIPVWMINGMLTVITTSGLGLELSPTFVTHHCCRLSLPSQWLKPCAPT